MKIATNLKKIIFFNIRMIKCDVKDIINNNFKV